MVWAEGMKVSFQYVDVKPVIRSMCCADTVWGGAHSLA